MNPRLRFRRVAAVVAVGLALGWAFLARRDIGPQYLGRTMEEWVDASVREGNPQLSAAAVEALGTNALPALIQILEREESPLRMALYSAWLRLPDAWRDRVPAPRLWHLHRQATAVWCVSLLGSDGAPAVPVLIAHLRKGDLDEAASQALARIGPAAHVAVPTLVDRLSKDPGLAGVNGFWLSLWKMGPSAMDGFKQMSNHIDPRLALLGTAGSLWFNGATDAALEHLEAGVFEGFVRSSDSAPEVAEQQRELAIALLQELGPGLEPLVPVLKGHLQSTANPAERAAAAAILAGLGGTTSAVEASRALCEALRVETDSGTRRGEIRALARLGSGALAAVPLLETLLQGSDEDAIAEARAALRLIVADEPGKAAITQPEP